jgi:hypothetical protein
MTMLAAVGNARALDGREAGLQAAHQALNGLGSNTPVFGIVISSYQFDAQDVVNGIASLIGNTPVIGFSTPAGLTSDGLQPRAVTLALIASTDAHADVTWLAGYTQGSREVSQQLAGLLNRKPRQPALIFADGFNADAEQLCVGLPGGTNLIGALSSGDLNIGNAYQIGGAQFGSGGLALARLEGDVRVGVGYGAGWQPVGTHFRVTRSRGFWVRTLDGRPASEAYAHLFGYPARDWAFPPLNRLARLYPLGLLAPVLQAKVEQADKSLLPAQGSQTLVIRSPLRVEADGSFRMNATVSDGTEAYLLQRWNGGLPAGGESLCLPASRCGRRRTGPCSPRRSASGVGVGTRRYRLADALRSPTGSRGGCRAESPWCRCTGNRRLHAGADRPACRCLATIPEPAYGGGRLRGSAMR